MALIATIALKRMGQTDRPTECTFQTYSKASSSSGDWTETELAILNGPHIAELHCSSEQFGVVKGPQRSYVYSGVDGDSLGFMRLGLHNHHSRQLKYRFNLMQRVGRCRCCIAKTHSNSSTEKIGKVKESHLPTGVNWQRTIWLHPGPGV